MTKSWISGVVMVVFVFGLTAGTRADWVDNFDGYANGSTIIGQGAWVGWEQVGTDDTIVTNAQANSAPHSLQMGGATMVDLVPEFGGATSGIETLDVMTFVPTGSSTGSSHIGFLSRHKGFQGAANTQWFGPFTLDMAGNQVPGDDPQTIIRDQWIPVHVDFDIDNKSYDIYYNSVLVKSGTWGGDNAIVGFDVWSPGGASTLYYDDFNMTPEPATLALVVMGGLGLITRRRRNK